MLSTIFAKTVRDLRRSIVGWGTGIAILVILMAAFWPSVRDMTDLDALIAQYPEALRELFGIESMTSGTGFMNAELFTLILPALFIVYGVGRGARMIAGEEQAGTLDVLLMTPVSRTRVLLEKAGALAVALVALGVVLFVTAVGASMVIGMGLGIADTAVASLAMVLLGLEHGWLALAIGAGTGRRVLAIAVSSSVAVTGYLIHVLGSLVDVVEPLKPLSPFHQALADGPLGGGGSFPATFLALALGAIVAVGVAIPAFDRRDVALG